MNEVYIVWGQTGSYDSRSEWILDIFTKKEDAECCAQDYNDYLIRINSHTSTQDRLRVLECIQPPYDDEQFSYDRLTGTNYSAHGPYLVLDKYIPKDAKLAILRLIFEKTVKGKAIGFGEAGKEQTFEQWFDYWSKEAMK